MNLWLASHVVALSMDVHSTNYALNSCANSNGYYYCRELNPLPGMQSSVGRIAWSAVEAAALEVARRKSKKVGRIATVISIGLHAGLAVHNYKLGNQAKGGVR